MFQKQRISFRNIGAKTTLFTASNLKTPQKFQFKFGLAGARPGSTGLALSRSWPDLLDWRPREGVPGPGPVPRSPVPARHQRGLGVLAEKAVELSQTVETVGDILVFRPQGLFPDRQRPFVKRLGLSVLVLEPIDSA